MYQLSTFFLRVHVFLNLASVVADKTVGSLDDVLRRAVVLFEFEQLCTLVEFLEREYVINVSPTETVDALCIITHHTHVPRVLRQLPYDGVLGIVRVLILIHEHEMEMLLILLQNLRMLCKELVGIDQDVIEVHGVGLSAPVHVALVDLTRLWNPAGLVGLLQLGISHISRRRHQPVLGCRDVAQHSTGLVLFVVQLHLANDTFDQTLAVGGVVDGEVRRETYGRALAPEYAREDTMEGAHPQPACTLFAHLTPDAFLHLVGGLVREGQSQYVPWLHPLFEQVCYFVGEHTRLSGPGSGNDQRRSVEIEHGSALCLVQLIEIHILSVGGGY